MIYKEEFLNIFKEKKDKDDIEILSKAVKQYEDKFNKDFSEFNMIEMQEVHRKFFLFKDIIIKIKIYINFIREKLNETKSV
jgi:hypothetical protein